MIAAPLKDGRFGEASVSLMCAGLSTPSFHLGAFYQDHAPQRSDIVKLVEEREANERKAHDFQARFGSVIAWKLTEAKPAIPGMLCLPAFTSPHRGSLRLTTRVGMPAILLMLA